MPVVMVSLRLDYFKNRLGYTEVGLWNFWWFAFLWLSPFVFSLDVSRWVTLSSFYCHFPSLSSLKVRGQGRCVAGGWRSCVLFCKLFSLSICHLVLKRCVHCPRWPPGGQGQCILGLPWGVLGWPKTLFGFFQRSLKTQKNFLANTVLALITLSQSQLAGEPRLRQRPCPGCLFPAPSTPKSHLLCS